MVLAIAVGLLLFAAGVWIGARLDDGGESGASPPAGAARGARDRAPGLAAPGDREAASSPPKPLGPLVALVIDDLGRSVGVLEDLDRLGVPLSYSVLPFEPRTEEIVRALAERRAEVLCHLPMEADGDADPGPGALLSSMSARELRRATERALEAVPVAVGVNNHMGSVLSTRHAAMDVVLGVLAERRLFFLDSRTSPHSVGYALAVEKGIPAAERQVFLDGDPRPEAIRGQFYELLRLADERGAAIAIGHPHPETLEVLEKEVARARLAGYRFVPLSYLLDREGHRSAE